MLIVYNYPSISNEKENPILLVVIDSLEPINNWLKEVHNSGFQLRWNTIDCKPNKPGTFSFKWFGAEMAPKYKHIEYQVNTQNEV